VQLGMGRIAVSITHEAEYAVAIAFGIRAAGGRYVFPPDIEARLDDRERRILARMERLRSLSTSAADDADAPDGPAEADEADGDGSPGTAATTEVRGA
jgi:hypothetical protein